MKLRDILDGYRPSGSTFCYTNEHYERAQRNQKQDYGLSTFNQSTKMSNV